MYLTHLASITCMVDYSPGANASAFVKFAIVLAVTTIRHRSNISSLLRATAIGELLNGRDIRGSLPKCESPSTVHVRAHDLRYQSCCDTNLEHLRATSQKAQSGPDVPAGAVAAVPPADAIGRC